MIPHMLVAIASLKFPIASSGTGFYGDGRYGISLDPTSRSNFTCPTKSDRNNVDIVSV